MVNKKLLKPNKDKSLIFLIILSVALISFYVFARFAVKPIGSNLLFEAPPGMQAYELLVVVISLVLYLSFVVLLFWLSTVNPVVIYPVLDLFFILTLFYWYFLARLFYLFRKRKTQGTPTAGEKALHSYFNSFDKS